MASKLKGTNASFLFFYFLTLTFFFFVELICLPDEMEKLIRHRGSPDSDKGLNAYFPRSFLRDSTKSSGAKNRMEAV